ncbi:MAG: TAXI family TRAP transporter solute-binding subunit [Beijerinckiaceae bacterium]|nr:TAXI family TRAP transporter solute-binding subunit [Beijerinckiaceae bacterium]
MRHSKFKTISVTAVAAIAATSLSTQVLAQAPKPQNFLLATASTGGTYYPVGVALATLIKVKLQPKLKINMSAISSAGSGENIKLLRTNEVQFGILQGLYGAYAATGTGPLKKDGPQKHLNSVSMLWSNVEHFVVPASAAKTGTVSDLAGLKGKGAALGAKNSGTLGSNSVILKNLGIDANKDFNLVYGGYGPAMAALQNGQVMLASTPAGAPVSAVTQVFAKMGADKVRVLDFTDAQMKQANGEFGDLWTRLVIKAGTYPGQTKAINTVAQPNFLAVRADLPEETIYLITKTIYENLPFLQSIHPATKAMSLEQATAGLPVKLHKGALRYYMEKNLKVSDKLK